MDITLKYAKGYDKPNECDVFVKVEKRKTSPLYFVIVTDINGRKFFEGYFAVQFYAIVSFKQQCRKYTAIEEQVN